MTDRNVREVVDPDDAGYFFRNAGKRIPAGFEGYVISRVVVRDARVMPDGKVRAEVRWAGEGVRVQVFERVDGRWLLVEERPGRAGPPEATGDPADTGDAPAVSAIPPDCAPYRAVRIGGVEMFEPGAGGATFEIDAQVVVNCEHLRAADGRRIDALPWCEPPAVIRTATDTQVLLRCHAPDGRDGGVPATFRVEALAWRPASEVGSGRAVVDTCEQTGVLGKATEFSCSVRNPGGASDAVPGTRS